jgi:DNA-binding Lrp family transcriptional regulator
MNLATAPSFVNPSFSRPRQIGYAKVPEDMLERLDHPTAERVYRALCECMRRGWFDPPIRWLAARVKRSYMQVTRGLNRLKAAGYIRWVRRRISRTRNATNVYVLVGVTITHVIEKQKREVKTKAPRAARAISSPRKRSYEELEMRVRYYERGERNARWRNKREEDRRLLAANPRCITGTISEDVVEWLRQRDEQRQARAGI